MSKLKITKSICNSCVSGKEEDEAEGQKWIDKGNNLELSFDIYLYCGSITFDKNGEVQWKDETVECEEKDALQFVRNYLSINGYEHIERCSFECFGCEDEGSGDVYFSDGTISNNEEEAMSVLLFGGKDLKEEIEKRGRKNKIKEVLNA